MPVDGSAVGTLCFVFINPSFLPSVPVFPLSISIYPPWNMWTCPYGEVLAHRLVRAEPRVPSARCISERPCRTDQTPAEGQPLNEIVAKWRGHRCMPLRQLTSSHSRWPLPS